MTGRRAAAVAHPYAARIGASDGANREQECAKYARSHLRRTPRSRLCARNERSCPCRPPDGIRRAENAHSSPRLKRRDRQHRSPGESEVLRQTCPSPAWRISRRRRRWASRVRRGLTVSERQETGDERAFLHPGVNDIPKRHPLRSDAARNARHSRISLRLRSVIGKTVRNPRISACHITRIASNARFPRISSYAGTNRTARRTRLAHRWRLRGMRHAGGGQVCGLALRSPLTATSTTTRSSAIFRPRSSTRSHAPPRHSCETATTQWRPHRSPLALPRARLAGTDEPRPDGFR